METTTHAPQEAFINEGIKNFLVFRSIRELLKTMLGTITSLRAYHSSKDFKRHIDAIARTNQESLAVLNAFELFYIQKEQPTAEEQATYRMLKDANIDFALMGYRTSVEKWNDLHNHMTNFHQNSYAVVDDAIVDAFMSAPTDYSAGMMELVNRYFPDASRTSKEAFAVGIEKLIHVRAELGVRV